MPKKKDDGQDELERKIQEGVRRELSRIQEEEERRESWQERQRKWREERRAENEQVNRRKEQKELRRQQQAPRCIDCSSVNLKIESRTFEDPVTHQRVGHWGIVSGLVIPIVAGYLAAATIPSLGWSLFMDIVAVLIVIGIAWLIGTRLRIRSLPSSNITVYHYVCKDCGKSGTASILPSW